MTTLALNLVLQLAVPVLLICCIAFFPMRGRAAFWIQASATAAMLAAIALVGLWTMLPWWTPYVYALLFVLALSFSLRRASARRDASRTSLSSWVAGIFFLCIGGLGLYQAGTALYGRIPPHKDMVDLAFPFRAGSYLVANGGASTNINSHVRTLDAAVPRYRAWRGQSYGVDIVQVDRAGFRADGLLPPAPEAYRIYGAQVFAPCSGTVVSVACTSTYFWRAAAHAPGGRLSRPQ